MKRLGTIALLFLPSAFNSIAQDLDWKLYLEDELVRKSESLSFYADGDGCFQGGYSLEWNDADWNQIKKSDEDVSLDCLGNGLYKVNPSEGESFYVRFMGENDPTAAWVPDPNGIEDYPMGTKIVLEGPVYNEAIDILNGYQYRNEIFDANSRIKRLALYVNDTYWFEVELSDVMWDPRRSHSRRSTLTWIAAVGQ